MTSEQLAAISSDYARSNKVVEILGYPHRHCFTSTRNELELLLFDFAITLFPSDESFPAGFPIVDKLLVDIKKELLSAVEKHNKLNSAHEAYAVILEELDEFWELVKMREFDNESALKELIQVAAMAVRTCIDVLRFGADVEQEKLRKMITPERNSFFKQILDCKK